MWDLSYWLAGFGPLVVPIQNQETMGIHEWLQGHPYRPIITRSCPGHYVKDSGESCKFFHQIISHWLCGWLHINIKNQNKKLPTYPGNKDIDPHLQNDSNWSFFAQLRPPRVCRQSSSRDRSPPDMSLEPPQRSSLKGWSKHHLFNPLKGKIWHGFIYLIWYLKQAQCRTQWYGYCAESILNYIA